MAVKPEQSELASARVSEVRDTGQAAPRVKIAARVLTAAGEAQQSAPVIRIRDLNVWYGKSQAIFDVNMDIPGRSVTAVIGPSGCGKSTLLRCINRMNDLIVGIRVQGRLLLEGQDVYDPKADAVTVRRHIGMVFQKPNPFPKSIYDNIAFGLRIRGVRRRSVLDEIVEQSLRDAVLWSEVKDELGKSALALSGGQQQRLCIARALAGGPRALLMDEPCSALDPVATAKIEELIAKLKDNYTIVIVTHNMQQAARVSDKTAFFCLGKLIEYNLTRDLFTNPWNQQTEDYITGRFG